MKDDQSAIKTTNITEVVFDPRSRDRVERTTKNVADDLRNLASTVSKLGKRGYWISSVVMRNGQIVYKMMLAKSDHDN